RPPPLRRKAQQTARRDGHNPPPPRSRRRNGEYPRAATRWRSPRPIAAGETGARAGEDGSAPRPLFRRRRRRDRRCPTRAPLCAGPAFRWRGNFPTGLRGQTRRRLDRFEAQARRALRRSAPPRRSTPAAAQRRRVLVWASACRSNAANPRGCKGMPGLGPGISHVWRLRVGGGLAAPLGLPDARAGAVTVAAPGSRAARARKPTLAGRGLVAGADGHDHGAVLGDLAADVDGRRSPVAEVAVHDAHRIAIGRIALAGLG